MCVEDYFKECFILAGCFFLFVLLFIRVIFPLELSFFLFSSFSFDENMQRCRSCMNHWVLVLFSLFTLLLVWNLSLQILLLLVKAA